MSNCETCRREVGGLEAHFQTAKQLHQAATEEHDAARRKELAVHGREIRAQIFERRVQAARELIADGEENAGICLRCGAENGPVEPDATKYTCEECGAAAVYGCEQLLFLATAAV